MATKESTYTTTWPQAPMQAMCAALGASEAQVLAMALNHLYTAMHDGGRFQTAGIDAPALDGMLVPWTSNAEIDGLLARLREADRG